MSAVLFSVALTALIFLIRGALAFDPFAEVTINNASGEVISEVQLKQGNLTINARNIQPGEHLPMRFERHPPSLDTSYSVTVRFADGRTLPEGGSSIGRGEKHEEIIRKDQMETALVRSGW